MNPMLQIFWRKVAIAGRSAYFFFWKRHLKKIKYLLYRNDALLRIFSLDA